jgi:hypothetical protein
MSVNSKARAIIRIVVYLALTAATTACSFVLDSGRSASEREHLRPTCPAYRLPYAALWNTGQRPGGFDPDWQAARLRENWPLLPSLYLGPPGQERSDPPDAYYEAALHAAAARHIPISFVSTQWESLLPQIAEFRQTLPSLDPRVSLENGSVGPKLSPFGRESDWFEVGKMWTSRELLTRLAKLYPNPPQVIFLSNNEQPKLRMSEVRTDRRAASILEKGSSSDDIRSSVGRRWHSLYKALFRGMREGLPAEWRGKAVFVGYSAFGERAMGRWPGWSRDVLDAEAGVSWNISTWGGASVAYYVDSWSGLTDYTASSPQIEAMNWVPMLEMMHQTNPCFLMEMSTWDGNSNDKNDKRAYYRGLDQQFSPQRYEGYVQFGMWLLRPYIVREFRKWTDTVDNQGAYFAVIAEAVERVRRNSELRKFWERGRLIPNRSKPHPYHIAVPAIFQRSERWYLLDTSLGRPATPTSPVNVFALALELGEGEDKEALVYAHSPIGARDNVVVSVPGFGKYLLRVEVEGTFCIVAHAKINGKGICHRTN